MEGVDLNQSAINVATGGLVLTLTQATKRWTPEGWGPIIAAIWTTIAMLAWLISQPNWPPDRGVTFVLMSAWVSVYATALGIYSAVLVPSNSHQAIGTGGKGSGDGNVPVGETKPKPKRVRKPKPKPEEINGRG